MWACMPSAEVREGAFRLMAVQDAQIEPIRQWRNRQMDVLRQLEPISEGQQRDYYANHVWPWLDHSEPPSVLVSYVRDDVLIGYGGLVHIAWEHRRAEVSFLLDPDTFEDDTTYSALFVPYLGLIQRLAFEELRLNRIWTETFSFRSNHIRCLERAGLRPEGVLRQHVWVQGEPFDCILHGRLRDDEG